MLSYVEYKKVRNTAWQVLIDNNINSLPVNLSQIAKNSGVRIIKNSTTGMLSQNELAMGLLDEQNKWVIVYSDIIENVGRKRFSIAHELGHIFLGHSLAIKSNGGCLEKPWMESEADMFAARLLAPACVLKGLRLSTGEEVSKFCNISLTAGKIRAKRLADLYKRDRFFMDPLEKILYANFMDFVDQNYIRV